MKIVTTIIMNIATTGILIPIEELTPEIEKKIKSIIKKGNQFILSQTVFQYGVFALNYDLLIPIKAIYENSNIQHTVVYPDKMKEFCSCRAIKVNGTTASIRNINYIRTPKTTQI